LALCVTLAACATTRQPRSKPETSGFLGDYSQLRPGGDDQAQLVYLNPDVDFSEYAAIQIESVTVWGEAGMSSIPSDGRQALTDRLYEAIHDALRKDWSIVHQPGPGVMTLRAALTEAKGSKVALDTVTTAIPQVRLLASAVGLSADTAATVGKARVEGEIRDSLTGIRLMAAVDERVGSRSFSGVTDKWSDVEEAFAYWAERLRKRLAELRGG
jgi:hypothetical protein